MENLIFKPTTDDNIKTVAELCVKSFDTQRGTVSDELFADGSMGSALYEVMKEPHIDGWAIHDEETKLWTTITPLSAVKNLMFYVNKCGFHITKIIEKENEKICLFEKVML